MTEVSRLRKIRKLLIPWACVLNSRRRSSALERVVIAPEFCYCLLPVPLEHCSSRKIAECLDVIRINPRRIDRVPPATAWNFRSSRSVPRPAALTPAGSFWTRFRRPTAWPSSSCSTSTRATIACWHRLNFFQETQIIPLDGLLALLVGSDRSFCSRYDVSTSGYWQASPLCLAVIFWCNG